MTKNFKVGIIGLGVGERHIPAFNRHPNCTVVSICDFSESKLASVANRFPGMTTTLRSDDILNDPSLGIVSIASYDNYHFEQIRRALGSGKHVFMEKPLCLYRDEAVEIKKMLKDRPGLELSSNLNLRTSPMFLNVRENIRCRAFGDLYYIEADYLWGRLEKLRHGWRNEMDYYSVIHGASVHMIDLVLWLTGKKPEEVVGYGNQIATKDSDFHFNDFAAILLKFPDGMTVKISANAGCRHRHFHTLSVFGTKKTFLHNSFGSAYIQGQDGNFSTIDRPEGYPAADEKGRIIYSFVDALVHGASQPIVSTTDVFDTMSVCFAAEEAVRTGKPVAISFI